MKLDDWVLCRIYNKNITTEKLVVEKKENSMDVPMESHAFSIHWTRYSTHVNSLDVQTPIDNIEPPLIHYTYHMFPIRIHWHVNLN